jgi:DNA-binding response OmpR family regulator
MKNAIFYSPDLNLCVSLLLYFQDKYKVTTTTDLEVLNLLSINPTFDIIIIDADPNKQILNLCHTIKEENKKSSLILTYVFKNQIKDTEKSLRLYADAIFYKPVDLEEVTKNLNLIVANKTNSV